MKRLLGLAIPVAVVALLLTACEGREPPRPAPGECLDDTSINRDWSDDFLCARNDGTLFRTSEEGANLWVDKQVLPYSGRRDSDPCTANDRLYVNCVPTE